MDNPAYAQPQRDFELLKQDAGGSWVRLRFRGPFEGRDILWDALFRTRKHGAGRNAIEIGSEGADGRSLTVTLALPCFDLPAIRKTIIMIRQYKRLRQGRIEFG
jgi:hypothetical protein